MLPSSVLHVPVHFLTLSDSPMEPQDPPEQAPRILWSQLKLHALQQDMVLSRCSVNTGKANQRRNKEIR